MKLHSLHCTFSDWSLCACPFPSIDLCMSSNKGLWMWVKLLLTSTIARQLTHSCTLNWTAFFKLYLFLPGAYAHVPSDPLICVWAAAEGENVSETVVDIYNCKATHSLTHSYLDETAFCALCLIQCFIVVGITAIFILWSRWCPHFFLLSFSTALATWFQQVLYLLLNFSLAANKPSIANSK